MGRFESILDKIPQLRRGIVWCTVCGRQQRVDSAAALTHGWPKCCGYTMTIDSPEERQAFAVAQGARTSNVRTAIATKKDHRRLSIFVLGAQTREAQTP